MRRSGEYSRNGRKEALSDAISRIFSERASFELREDDVEALRQQLKVGSISHENLTQIPEETAKWKVITSSCLSTQI